MPVSPNLSGLFALTVLLTSSLGLSAMADSTVPLPMIYSAITTTVEPSTQPLRPYVAPHAVKNITKLSSSVTPLALVAVAPAATTKPAIASKAVASKAATPLPAVKIGAASKAPIKPAVKPTIAVATKPADKAVIKPVPVKPTVVKATPASLASSTGVSVAMKAQPFLATPVTLAVGQTLPESYSTAASVLSDMQKSPSVSLHVEALRRAAQSLPPAQYGVLINGVQQRFNQQPSSALRQMDWGYTKLVFEKNKAGLFYLRKANDELDSPVAAMTYGLAQAAVDTLVEHSPTNEMTMRKLDVMHKLDDALILHAKRPVAGFWPTYRTAMNQLASVPAYADWVATDRSETLVPTGDSVELAYNFLAMVGPVAPNSITTTTLNDTPSVALATCQRLPFNDATQKANAWLPKDAMKTLGVTVQGEPATAYVFQGKQPLSDPTLVLTQEHAVLATVTSKRVPYVLEDTDHDGTPEIVVRQFLTAETTPELGGSPTGPVTLSEKPLQVYRYNGCQYELDKAVSALFD